MNGLPLQENSDLIKHNKFIFSFVPEVGDKVFFEEGPWRKSDRYSAFNSGQVMQGEHFGPIKHVLQEL